MRGYWAILIITLGIVLFSVTAYAQNSAIPDWVKNNAKWWSEGQIGESDYISSLQYLINEGIIKVQVPITKVIATELPLSESDTAQSIVVRYLGGDYFRQEVTIYTYSTFFHFSETVRTITSIGGTSAFTETPLFILRSLPSLDKQIIYDLVNKYVRAGKSPEPFDVSVDILTGDGDMLQSWQYRKCDVLDYSTYVDSDKDTYRFGKSDKAEIRELILFGCAGFHLVT